MLIEPSPDAICPSCRMHRIAVDTGRNMYFGTDGEGAERIARDRPQWHADDRTMLCARSECTIAAAAPLLRYSTAVEQFARLAFAGGIQSLLLSAAGRNRPAGAGAGDQVHQMRRKFSSELIIETERYRQNPGMRPGAGYGTSSQVCDGRSRQLLLSLRTRSALVLQWFLRSVSCRASAAILLFGSRFVAGVV